MTTPPGIKSAGQLDADAGLSQLVEYIRTELANSPEDEKMAQIHSATMLIGLKIIEAHPDDLAAGLANAIEAVAGAAAHAVIALAETDWKSAL